MTKMPDFNGSGASYNIWIKRQNLVPYVVVNHWIPVAGHWFLVLVTASSGVSAIDQTPVASYQGKVTSDKEPSSQD
jgi:hypothetical protein